MAPTPNPGRDGVRSAGLESLGRDLRLTLRSLARAPGFVLSVIVTLVLGIGFGTAVFHMIAPVLLYPPPYRNPGELYTLGYQYRATPFAPYRAGIFLQAYRDQTNVFSEFAAFNVAVTNVTLEGTPHIATTVGATSDTFHTLGVAPVLGRGFLPDEFAADNAGVIVVSHEFWRQYLGGRRDAIGRKILIDEAPCEVVGVLGNGRNLPLTADVIRPLHYRADPQKVFDPMLWIIGRLKPGVPVSAARDAIDAVKVAGVPQWAAAFFADQRAVLKPVGDFTGRSNFWVLVIAAAFLFGIACLNAANLTLVRLISRSRELSVRLAIGGTRRRLIQLLLWEPQLLAIAAGGLVAGLVYKAFPYVFARLYGPNAEFSVYLDAKTVACITVLTCIAAGALVLVPVLRVARMDAFANLKSTGNAVGESLRVGRVRNALAVMQAALAVMLLGGTGLMVRTFQKVHELDLGFDPVGKVDVAVMFPPGFEPKPKERLQYFDRLKERLVTLPGVRAVASGQNSILAGFAGTGQLLMGDGSYRPIAGNFVSADYQKTLGLVVRRGRWFSDKGRTPEVVINETLAKMRFGDADPIGRPVRLQVSGDHDYLVVGVVEDVRDAVRMPSGPRMYMPDWMYPPNVSTLVLRLDRDPPPEFEGIVRRAIYGFDPHLVTTAVMSVDTLLDRSLAAERFIYLTLRGIALVALGLSVIGLYSVMAYTTRARTREFGVRLAIGATATDLWRLVVLRSLRVAGLGVLLGLAVALGAAHFMKSLLFETTPYDPFVYGVATVVLVAAALAASWLPARRAAKTNPIEALRTE
jgi:predicted permease